MPLSSWIVAGQQCLDGLDDGADAAGGASGSAEQSPGLQLYEGTLKNVVAAELLVVLGVFAVVV
jgi:hypothetical protein